MADQTLDGPDPTDLRQAIAFVQAQALGEVEEFDRLVASSDVSEALLVALASVAGTLAKTLALYGDVSVIEALSLISADVPD